MHRLLFITTLLVLVGCGSDKTKIIITGSSTVAPVMAAISERYEQDNPNIRIDVQSGGSSRGISDVRKGLSQVGMISRNLRESESDLKAIPIASDGIALIVHASNPIKHLDSNTIQNIYTGKVNSWKDLNGTSKPIVVVHKDTGRATRDVFLKHFNLPSESIKANIVIGENAEGIKTVASNPLAIGYVSIGAAEKEKSLGTNIKLLPLNGIAANTKNLKNQTYPAVRFLNLVIKNDSNQPKEVDQLLEFTTQTLVHDIIEGKQFVPINR